MKKRLFAIATIIMAFFLALYLSKPSLTQSVEVPLETPIQAAEPELVGEEGTLAKKQPIVSKQVTSPNEQEPEPEESQVPAPKSPWEMEYYDDGHTNDLLTFYGTVFDPEGERLEGVDISLLSGNNTIAAANTDEQGAYRIEVVLKNSLNYQIIAKHDLYAWAYDGFLHDPNIKSRKIDFHLEHRGIVTGRVISDDGMPLANAAIEMRQPRKSGIKICETGKDGSFVAEQVPASGATLTAFYWSEGGGFSTTDGQWVEPPQTLLFEIELAPIFEGTVVDDETGKAIPLFHIDVLGQREHGRSTNTYTFQNGTFEFVFPHANSYRLTFRADGYETLVLEDAKGRAPYEIRLTPAKASLKGRVVTKASLDGAHVLLIPATLEKALGHGGSNVSEMAQMFAEERFPIRGTRFARVDVQGRFHFEGLGAKQVYTIGFFGNHFPSQMSALPLSEMDLREEIDFPLKLHAEVYGEVDQEVFPKATHVSLESRQHRQRIALDASNAFHFMEVPEGSYQLQLYHDQNYMRSMDVEVVDGESKYVKITAEAADVSGIIVRDGLPLANVHLFLDDQIQVTDHAGAFHFENILLGTKLLMMHLGPMQQAAFQDMYGQHPIRKLKGGYHQIKVTQDGYHGTLKYPKTGRVYGRLMGMKHATYVGLHHGFATHIIPTDAQGYFSFEEIRSGEMYFELNQYEDRSTNHPILSGLKFSGNDVDLGELHLPKTGSLTVQLSEDLDCNAFMHLYNPNNFSSHPLGKDTGGYFKNNLIPGDYRLDIKDIGGPCECEEEIWVSIQPRENKTVIATCVGSETFFVLNYPDLAQWVKGLTLTHETGQVYAYGQKEQGQGAPEVLHHRYSTGVYYAKGLPAGNWEGVLHLEGHKLPTLPFTFQLVKGQRIVNQLNAGH